MSALGRALTPLALLFLLSSALPLKAQNYSEMSLEEIKTNIEAEHPAAFYVLAARLFDEGERDEAVFWFYAGQLRYRVHLICNPDLPPDGDAALFGALSEVIGSSINLYAFGDPERLLVILDEVMAWDDQAQDLLNPKDICAAAREDALAGLFELRDHIAENADMIRTERASRGLENR